MTTMTMTLTKAFVFFMTFLCYAAYHTARLPFSIVTPVLTRHCSNDSGSSIFSGSVGGGNESVVPCGWPPFDGSHGLLFIGAVDYGFLTAYALGMYVSGFLADRLHKSRFVGVGLSITCLLNLLLGSIFFLNIHSFISFFLLQILHGLAQTSGWPAIVGIFANWYDESHRGLLMGLWSAHAVVGNIVGAVLSSLFVDGDWGWSFIVPGLIMGLIGFITFFFLPPSPPKMEKGGKEEESKRLIDDDDDDDENKKGAAAASAAPAAAAADPPSQPAKFLEALFIPGVCHYSSSLFFNKLGVYTFVFWLPQYINHSTPLSPRDSGFLSIAFDVGGVFGGAAAGAAADATQRSAAICIAMSVLAVPCILLYNNLVLSLGFTTNILLLSLCGFFLSGPFTLITTDVSADLGASESLKPNTKATATVAGIVNGSGSIGAALSPLTVGLLLTYGGWTCVFWMLATTSFLSAAFLIPIAVGEGKKVTH